jgi:hypothetical protein
VVLNHYEQHVKNCKTCREGLGLLRKVERGLLATGRGRGVSGRRFLGGERRGKWDGRRGKGTRQGKVRWNVRHAEKTRWVS